MKLLTPLLLVILFTIVFHQPVFAASTPTYKVIKVIDGDTMDVQIGKKIERLRLIGVDTPETVDPRKPVQCFGKEASVYTKKTLLGKQISLAADPTQGERDKYGRLLRYVVLNGLNYNKRLIAEGYAHEYTYNIPYKYQAEFKKHQKAAQTAKKGLWAATSCAGKTTSVTKTTAIIVPVVAGPAVKKSTTDLCHTKGSKYYDQTKKYTSYKSLKECLASGGGMPK